MLFGSGVTTKMICFHMHVSRDCNHNFTATNPLFFSFLNFLLTVFSFYSSADDPRKIDHLVTLDGASERLQLFKANLLEEGSFDSVVEGCDGVFHTASPFYHDVKDPQVNFSEYFHVNTNMHGQ